MVFVLFDDTRLYGLNVHNVKLTTEVKALRKAVKARQELKQSMSRTGDKSFIISLSVYILGTLNNRLNRGHCQVLS